MIESHPQQNLLAMNGYLRPVITLMLIFIVLCFFIISVNAQKIYVDSSATGLLTGNTWVDAYTDLQVAIDSAEAGDTICVAEGTYYPSKKPRNCTNCDSTRDVTFHLPDSVVLLGGHPSGGGAREWKINKTMLCGDIGIKGDSSDNAFHVVISAEADSAQVLDGFYIQYGNANGPSSNILFGTSSANRRHGGGLIGRSPGSLIRNCYFIRNRATSSGGAIQLVSAMRITHSYFRRNVANFGGALQFTFTDPFIEHCYFVRNKCTGTGGAIQPSLSNAIIRKCVFRKNRSNVAGGGIGICRMH